jgi:predicted Holliday junction resolvase-like endonuclease
MKKNLNIVLIAIFSIVFYNLLLNIAANYKEKQILKEVLADYAQSLETHKNKNEFKRYIIKNFINPPKSKIQFKIWVKNRGILRQSALETLNGKAAVCGELSRVLIKLFREKGIKARRLYLFGGNGTSHVMLEYFDDKSNKWIALNSYKSTKYLENITQNKYTIKELFKKADPAKGITAGYYKDGRKIADTEGYLLDGRGERIKEGLVSRKWNAAKDKAGELFSKISPLTKSKESLNSTNNGSNNNQGNKVDNSPHDNSTNHNTPPSDSDNVSNKSINENENNVKKLANTEDIKENKSLEKVGNKVLK